MDETEGDRFEARSAGQLRVGQKAEIVRIAL
jgi:hypothetical protein